MGGEGDCSKYWRRFFLNQESAKAMDQVRKLGQRTLIRSRAFPEDEMKSSMDALKQMCADLPGEESISAIGWQEDEALESRLRGRRSAGVGRKTVKKRSRRMPEVNPP